MNFTTRLFNMPKKFTVNLMMNMPKKRTIFATRLNYMDNHESNRLRTKFGPKKIFIKQKMFLSGYDFNGDNLITKPNKTVNIAPEIQRRVCRETEILS